MTGLSLNEWIAIMGFNPWISNQLTNKLVPIQADCSRLMFEYDWQSADRAGRQSIRNAIQHAEELIRQYAGYGASPAFREATIRYPVFGDTRFARTRDIGSDDQWLSVVLPEGQIRALGVQVDTTPVVAALVYTDDDGDGLFETATATAAVPAGTTIDQVVARFLQSDCGSRTPPEVAPRSVALVGTAATMIFDTWTLVRPVRQTSAIPAILDPGNGAAPAATVCAASVEIFRRFCDPTGTTEATCMALLTWETAPWPWWCCGTGDSRDPAATATALCRAVIRDAETGVVGFGEVTYDATTGEWSTPCNWRRCRPPDTVTIRYQAGLPLDGIAMQQPWQTIVARLAAAELARPICACMAANKELFEWQADMLKTDQLGYQAPNDATNPLGARRGQIFAWRWITRNQLTRGIYAG